MMFAKIQEVIDHMNLDQISSERQEILKVLIEYIQKKKDENKKVALNFICTHNSRRSQFSQIWAQVAADHYGITAQCYSGGVEETAFNKRAVASLEGFGFKVTKEGSGNPKYLLQWHVSSEPLEMFSKMYDDAINPTSDFAAVMTCAHADENCPLVMGAEARIPLRYEDPKKYDDTVLEKAFYDYRSFEIATELFYVFSKIK